MADGAGKPWSDEELEAAVFGYMLLLGLERVGVSYPVSHFYELILAGPLTTRNEAAVRYRLRNITHVMEEQGLPTLDGFSAASQVGKHVKDRLKKIIQTYEGGEFFVTEVARAKERDASKGDYQALLDSVAELKLSLKGFTRPHMVGHNNPPEAIIEDSEIHDALAELNDRLDSLQGIAAQTPQSNSQLENDKKEIISITARLFDWGTNRVTKFVDAALVTAAPILIVKLTNMAPLILDVLAKMQKLIQ